MIIRVRTLAIAFASLFLVVSLAACGGGDKASTDTSTPGTTETKPAETGDAATDAAKDEAATDASKEGGDTEAGADAKKDEATGEEAGADASKEGGEEAKSE